MKTMKKGVSVLLVFLLVFGMLAALPATVSAATDDSQMTRATADDSAVASATYGDFKYDVMKTNEGYQYIAITGYTGNDSYVNIPESIKGLYVQWIEDEAFYGTYSMQSVRIPDYVNFIGIDAFSLCENLEYVNLPEYLYALDTMAFYGCTSLKTVTIPASMEKIGIAPFAACMNLKEIKVEAGNTVFTSLGGVLYTSDKQYLIEYPSAKSGAIYKTTAQTKAIMPYSFIFNQTLTDIIVGNKCVSIGDYAFTRSPKLRTVLLPKSVTYIGDGAFDGLNGFTVYAERGSYAQKYCSNNGVRWTTPPVLVTGIKLNNTKLNWPVGKSGMFRATVTPSNAKNKSVTWKSSNTKVATVDANGRLTAVGAGTATITCTASDGNGAKATCAVTVYQPMKGITLNTNKLNWPIGKSGKFKATITPANAANKNVKWASSNPKAATVDASGKLTAVGVGSTTITCTAADGSGAKATCAVTVFQPVKSIKLNNTKLNWPVGKSGNFKATLSPSNAKYKTVNWSSSNPKAATVDVNGRLTAVGVGSATITCTSADGMAKATCAVTVYQPVGSIKLNTNKLNWPIGKSGNFKATISPANAGNKNVKWTSSNPKAATVDSKGKLTAVGVGSTTITCTAADGRGASATCTVTVYQPAKSIQLNNTKLNWPVGKSGYFKAVIAPNNAKYKNVTWKSSNPSVAKVDADGKLTSTGVGSATITCTSADGMAKASCAVTVYQQAKSIKLNNTKLNWPIGKTGIFKAVISPSNAKYKTVTWKSSNPSVAKVDTNGRLTAVGVGTATITCTSKDNFASAACAVTVYDPNAPAYKVGDKITYTAYLSGVTAPLCGIDASIRYDGSKLKLVENSISFPYIGNPLYNTHEKNEILFNTARVDGFDFTKQEVLVSAAFTVTNASFTDKDISLNIKKMIDFDSKALKGTVKETITKS